MASLLADDMCTSTETRSGYLALSELALGHELVHHLVDAEARRFGARWELLEALEPLHEQGRSGVEQEVLFEHPVVVLDGVLAALEGIGPQVEELGYAHRGQRLAPDIEPRGT